MGEELIFDVGEEFSRTETSSSSSSSSSSSPLSIPTVGNVACTSRQVML